MPAGAHSGIATRLYAAADRESCPAPGRRAGGTWLLDDRATVDAPRVAGGQTFCLLLVAEEPVTWANSRVQRAFEHEMVQLLAPRTCRGVNGTWVGRIPRAPTPAWADGPTLGVMTATTSTPRPPATRYLESVIGVAAISCTIACTRYAKDADKAPTVGQRVELLRMSAEQVAAYERLAVIGQDAGVDVNAAAEPLVGFLRDFDERLRPVDWAERLVKTYLTFGLLVDFSMALTDALPEALRGPLLDVLSADRFGGFAAGELLDDITGDPQLAARLGLWGRRVVGEEIGTLQRLIARIASPLEGGADATVLNEVLSRGASSRMRGLGLRI